MTRGAALLLVLTLGHAAAIAQAVSQEYRVKAAYLYNFLKFVEWPDEGQAPLTICVAGRNPFGTVLHDLVRDQVVSNRPIAARIILEPEAGCHIVFVPNGAATDAYLRAARGQSTFTVGESNTFLQQGGIANFYVERGSVRFEIDAAAAERARIRISSRLLQLARITGAGEPAR